MILLLGSQKGGTGKSTLATNLAVELAIRGRDVLLLDCDPQRTASLWCARRDEEQADKPKVNSAQATGQNIRSVVADLAKRYQDLIIDTGGYDGVEFRSGLLVCNRLVIPTKASQADMETFVTVSERIDAARASRLDEGPEAVVVLSMCSTNYANEERRDAREYLGSFPNMGIAEHEVYERKIYRDAIHAGLGVVEMRNAKAANEIRLLADEVCQ